MKRKLMTLFIAVVTLSALLCGNAFATTVVFWLGHTIAYNLSYSRSATASLSFDGIPCYTFVDCKYYYYDGGDLKYKYGSDEAPNGGPVTAYTGTIPVDADPTYIIAHYQVTHDSLTWTKTQSVYF